MLQRNPEMARDRSAEGPTSMKRETLAVHGGCYGDLGFNTYTVFPATRALGKLGEKPWVIGEIAKQLTERFRATQAMTINKLIYFLEALLPPRRESVC